MNHLTRLAIHAATAAGFLVALGAGITRHHPAVIAIGLCGVVAAVMAIVETVQHQRTTEVQRRTIARERARADYAEAEIKRLRRAQHEKNMW